MTWQNPAEALEKSGWARTVGSANPYLALLQRSGSRRAAVDAALDSQDAQELPCARGCTYLVPRKQFGLALRLGFKEASKPLAKALVGLGVTEREVEHLKDAVLEALKEGPLEPASLKKALGAEVRSLGEAGKKIGQTTTLSLALGPLQSGGFVRRVSLSGRLDTERYAYALWDAHRLPEFDWSEERAAAELACLYFSWTGGATLKQFQSFSGLGVAAAKAAVAELALAQAPWEDGWICFAQDAEAYAAFEPPAEPSFRLVASLDNHFHLRRDLSWATSEGASIESLRGNGLLDLPSHAILRDGELIGMWEFDPEAGQIVHKVWNGDSPQELLEEVDRVAQVIREDLEDFRSMSLDSPKSRQPRIEALRT